MTVWQLIDKTFDRLRVEHVAGFGVFLLTIYVLRLIETHPTLANNDLFKMLAQAIIVQGLVGLAMAAWFTKGKREGEQTDLANKALDIAAANSPEQMKPDVTLKPGETAQAQPEGEGA